MNASQDHSYEIPLYERLLESVPLMEEGRAWDLADPYLLRHITDHAERAGAVDLLLEDPEFLVYADPESVNAVLGDAVTAKSQLAAAVYRASFRVHRKHAPEQRRQILAVDAARLKATELCRDLAKSAAWTPLWATGKQVAAELAKTLVNRGEGVTAMASATVRGRSVLVLVTGGSEARVWDLATGTTMATISTGDAPITAVAASSDADERAVLVTGCRDGEVHLWDLASMDAYRTARSVRGGSVSAVTFTRVEGQLVAFVGNSDGTMWTWDLKRVESPLLDVQRPYGPARQIAAVVDSESTWAFTCSEDRVCIWNVATGELVNKLPHDHDGAVLAVAATRVDGRTVIITGGEDGTARIWDRSRGRIAVLRGHRGSVTSVATASVDGRTVIITGGEDGRTVICDFGDWGKTRAIAGLRGHRGGVTAVAAARIGRRSVVITGGSDGTTRIWDLSTVRQLMKDSGGEAPTGHDGGVSAVDTATVHGRMVAVTAGHDTRVMVWDVTTGELLTASQKGQSGRISAAATTTVGGRAVMITGDEDGAVHLWDLTTGSRRRELVPPDGRKVSVVATGQLDGMPIAFTSRGHSLQVWDLLKEKEHSEASSGLRKARDELVGVATLPLHSGGHAERTLVITASSDGAVFLWDPRTGQQRGHFYLSEPITAFTTAQLKGQQLVVVGCHDGSVRMWDPLGGHVPALGLPPGHDGPVTAAAFGTIEGRPTLVTAGKDRTARVWDLGTSTCLTTLTFPAAPRCLAIPQNGSILLGMGHEVIALTLNPLIARHL